MLSDLTLQPRPSEKSHPVSLGTPELEGLRETGDGDRGHTGSLVRAGVAVRAGRRHTSNGEVSEVFPVPPSRCHGQRLPVPWAGRSGRAPLGSLRVSQSWERGVSRGWPCIRGSGSSLQLM